MNPYIDNKSIIALDAMGGDNSPIAIIEGASLALNKYPNIYYNIFGNEALVTPILNKFPNLKNHYSLFHTDKLVKSEDKPSAALRSGRDSSMGLAIKSVKNGESIACVSSGNTGALMAISKITLRTLPGVSRPAIAGLVPTLKGKSVMLDLGANSECDSENLIQFAIMGDAFAKVILEKNKPVIGLLNIGSEDAKGNDTIKNAGNMLKSLGNDFNFHGYIEGHNIAEGTVDVVVTDGFSGNVAIKTAEGTAKICKNVMAEAFNDSWLSKIGYLLSKKALKKSLSHIDSRKYNGAMFLGLKGIIVKSHGSADSAGFCNAIYVAAELAYADINAKILYEMNLSGHLSIGNMNESI